MKKKLNAIKTNPKVIILTDSLNKIKGGTDTWVKPCKTKGGLD